MVNYTWFAWKLACTLRTYRKCNPTVDFSKYEFNNNLLIGVIFFRVISCVTCTQPYIRLHYLYIFFMLTKFQGDPKLIAMSLINCLNSSFCSLK